MSTEAALPYVCSEGGSTVLCRRRVSGSPVLFGRRRVQGILQMLWVYHWNEGRTIEGSKGRRCRVRAVWRVPQGKERGMRPAQVGRVTRLTTRVTQNSIGTNLRVPDSEGYVTLSFISMLNLQAPLLVSDTWYIEVHYIGICSLLPLPFCPRSSSHFWIFLF